MVLKVVICCFEIHDEVLLLIDIELYIFDLFPIFFHDFL